MRTRSRFIFLEIASYKRCSRPLCSSQTTTPYTTPHTHNPQGALTCVIGGARKPETNKPTPQPAPPQGGHRPRHGPVASGPNSVPNTKPPGPSPAPFQNIPEGTSVLGAEKTTRPLFADIPPMSTRRRTCVCATGCTPDKPPHPAYTGPNGL